MHPCPRFRPCSLQFLNRFEYPLPHRVIDHFNLAVAVPLVAVVAVCPGTELEERQGLVPGTDLAAAWVFGLGS